MLARKALLHYLNTIVGGILGAVALKLVALYMGDAILGNVAYALGVISIAQTFFTPGALRTTHEKRVGEGHREGDKNATYLYLQLGLNGAFGAAVLIGLAVWTLWLGKRFHATTLMVLVIIAGAMIAQNLRQVSVNTFNGRSETARSQTVTFIDDLARVAVTVLLTLIYAAAVRGRGPLDGVLGPGWDWVATYGPELLAGTYLVGSIASAGFGLAYMARTCPLGSFDLGILKNYWVFAWPLFLGGLMGTLSTNIDRVMLGYFWTGSEVGLYFGMDRIVHIIKSLTFALGAVLTPAIAGMAGTEPDARVGQVVRRSHRYTTMVIIPMLVGLIVFAEPIIRIILSEEFVRGVPVLWVMAVWVFFHVANRPYGAAVLGLNRPELTLFLGVGVVAVDIALNAVLIPADIRSLGWTLFGLGATGAALASMIAAMVRYVGTRYFARQLVPMDREWPYLARHLLAGGVMAAFLWTMQQITPGLLRWYHVMAFGLAGVLLYGGSLWLIGGVTKEDVSFFQDTLHLGQMWTYLKEELLGLHDDEP